MTRAEELELAILWEKISLPFPGFDKPYLGAGMDRIHNLRMELAGLQAAEMLRERLF